MLKIGDFSTLTKISIYMLRHYNEIGLLIPSHVDEFTGYRYYSENQLPIANKIQALKDMGISLAMIKDILSEYDDSERLRKYLMIQASQKKEEIAAMQKQLLLLERTINSLDKKSSLKNSSISITLKEIPQRNVVSLRDKIQSYADEGTLWRMLASETVSMDIKYASPCYDIAIFHDEGYMEQDIDVEIQRSVIGTYKDTARIKFKKVEPISAATLTFKGKYDWLREANEAIATWITDNNYEFNKPMFNIYHISPETESNPENMITEVCFPIKRK